MNSSNADHNSPSEPKENSIGQNHHQEEIIHKLAMQLKNIGDSIDHRMIPEVRPLCVQQGPGRQGKGQMEQWLLSGWDAQKLAEHVDQ